ncbi:MAG: Peptidase and in kexin sedolisin [Pedosphaera sp.]|nr:Peptidase and in kexin sedolisin [Pedosphaera sp.]
MQRRPLFWFLVSLACLAGAIYFWRLGDRWRAEKAHAAPAATPREAKPGAVMRAQGSATNAAGPTAAAASGPLAYRLHNTAQTLTQLARNDRAILLANALIDTGKPLDLGIPASLRAGLGHGSYVVQARGAVDAEFRARLGAAGASIVSYIPNNAYLVRVSEAGAQQLTGDARMSAVVAYEPYYKLSAELLTRALAGESSEAGIPLKLTLFADAAGAVAEPLRALGLSVLRTEPSPFGPVVSVLARPQQLAALARLPQVQLLEKGSGKQPANDLTRTRLGGAAAPLVSTNYLGLTGSNVLITLADAGVDRLHPDLTNRVLGFDFNDTSGHGTHVAGIIAGSGVESSTVSNAVGSVMIAGGGGASNVMFRGLAPSARLYSLSLYDADADLQEAAARTNSLISNNSWNYGSTEYNIEAASYDAAVRDARPGAAGPQPVLFVFSAGNAGGGDEAGGGGRAQSILSPATAKNVITVGAIESPRHITNELVVDGVTNQPYLAGTDSSNRVASFSSRGNVGVGIEGDGGRFKPDVVAPGTMVVSDRSQDWDTNSYYHPVDYEYSTLADQTVETNTLRAFSIYVPTNAISVTIVVHTNINSPSPFPDTPIYVRYNDNPTFTVHDALGTNAITLPPPAPLQTDTTLFYSIANPTKTAMKFDVETIIASTNNHPELYLLQTNLNPQLDPWYRYESGTSMAAAGVSGFLGLMQEFFEQRLHATNSPALMKALLINGSRSLGAPYDLQASGLPNSQGWGLPALANSAPAALTNTAVDANILPLRYFDQSPTNALATGQRQTRKLSLSAAGQGQPLRVTLVWTDPPGNPAASFKLVNDLDLIVTNLDTGEVFYGNDIPVDGAFNQAWDTNSLPPYDVVNNVENVFLAPPMGSNYTVSVAARRVTVNALTRDTNNVVQDFALVISSGDAGQLTNAFTLAAPTLAADSHASGLTTLTNGLPLFNERVGGNSQFTGTTNGVTNQWNFYVYTNPTNFANVAFITFLPPELGVARIGTQESANPPNATRVEADIDMYVSTNPGLTNLDPAVLAIAQFSRTRTGTEVVLDQGGSFQGKVYYLAVKSEDQQGAEYALVGVASKFPFNQRDANGNLLVTMLGDFPVPIRDGSSKLPGYTYILGVTAEADRIRRVIVTNAVTHEYFPDLIGALSHSQKLSVLNNHAAFFNTNDVSETLVYDDSGEGDNVGVLKGPGTFAKTSDRPGTLQNFVGEQASGAWVFSMVDDALGRTGRVDSLAITVEPQDPTNNVNQRIGAFGSKYYFVDVPPNATNLTVTLGGSMSLPLDVYLRRGARPSQTVYDKSAVINPPGGSLSLTKFESPPLNPGRYYILVFNPNASPQTFNISFSLGIDLNPLAPYKFLSIGNEPILDDAVSYSTNYVGIASKVARAEVGVRIDHPRISDLVLTLISPHGTRVVLAENRGGLTTNGYGVGVNVINTNPPATSGNAAAVTNVIDTTVTSGTLVINYHFHQVPDTMHIYYDGVKIFDSGLISGSGSFSVDYGPGISTSVKIVMNEGGNPQATEWDYQVTAITRQINYTIFSEDTNFAKIPIKFAIPPFGTTNGSAATTVDASSFEGFAEGGYTSVDGWTTVDTNQVWVVKVPQLADNGSNVLALHRGSIIRTLPTLAGRKYTLSFATHGRPALLPVSWWKGEVNALDSADGNNGIPSNMTYAPGEVGGAFKLNGTNAYVSVPASGNLNVGTGNGFSIEDWINPVNVATQQPMLEWFNGTSGAHFWISVAFGGGIPGCVYANLIDTAGNDHVLTSGGNGPVVANRLQHVAVTYDKTSGIGNLFYNGSVVASTNLGVFTPQTTYNLFLGCRPSTLELFKGILDEMSLYNRSLLPVEIQDIYAAGTAGKCPVSGGNCTVTANVIFGGTTNVISALDAWSPNTYSFTAPTDAMVLEIQPNQNGLLLDSFKLVESSSPTNYFLPEEPLSKLVGEDSQGDWRLEVLDNRAGATNPAPLLVSWQLSLTLDTIVPYAIPLSHAITQTNTVNPFEIVYYAVDVPGWAQFATNLLFNVNGGSVNLLFNQSILPTGTSPGDYPLLTGAGTVVLTTNGAAPLLQQGTRYYLGVQNTGVAPVSFAIEVDFDITTLTNAIPLTNTLAAAFLPRYYQYDVSTNAIAVAFELLNPNGNVDLLARKGAPLPDEVNFDYVSAALGNNNEAIVVITNSLPVPLTAGRWYLGVFNRTVNPVTYAIRATETGPPTIITLTNGVPFNYSVGQGVLQTNFFRFVVDQTNTAALFELYSLSGNADLTLQRGSLPFVAPYFDGSFRPGTNFEQIVVRTNIIGTNINAEWFLGVPNKDVTTVTYTIRAVVSTNGMLISGIPITIGLTLPPAGGTNGPTLTWPGVAGESYEIQSSTDLVSWTVLSTIISAPGSTITFTDPNPITGFPYLFYRIVQIPVP